ncbi:N-acyl homoserine lactone hydrolase [Bradyrhizobium huanghuaihaiense]|uniref:Metallo-beta-lactamase superfamily protein n=1 Tax=Bradyrhizobium huanghuaihaiense TaxID=990078 RepID=A0A562S6D1_9BRAD|nr:N-acyl homoserine lactonase family protein [Bradyrhizobium huanghuaihaiense]TWI76364.1 metallo-beta-lactamase superfamily protein [Bradyrhizobium huanghuaihaiense]
MTTIDRIYILDGGIAEVEDGSIYSPGINVGVPMTLSCNAYLIRHRGAWLIWDTGIEDELAKHPEGRIIAHGIRGIVRRPIADQLDEIGVRPRDIRTILLSHAHFDHIGNVDLFENARWIAQRAEFEAMFGPEPEEFGYSFQHYRMLKERPYEIVDGDHDIFGDGAVRMIFTPGHTLGHSSLMVRLPRRGAVLLSGDVAHNRENLRHMRVPSFNADQQATVASMAKVVELLRVENAEIWINHDTAESVELPHAPDWIE